MMEDLKRENAELRTAITRMRVEKERLEDQFYRVFRRCLNSKKRKIRELQEQLEALGIGAKKKRRVRQRVNSSSGEEREEESDSSGDETDVDSQVVYENRKFAADDKEVARNKDVPLELEICEELSTPKKKGTENENQEKDKPKDDDDNDVDMCINDEQKGNKGSEKKASSTGKEQQASSGDETDFEDDVDLEDLTKDF